MATSIEALELEVEQLRQQISRSKPKEFIFLGEVIASEILPELTAGGKLSARGTQTRSVGMHGDGGNLWLQVTPGGRSWVFRYRWGAKQREMGLGALKDVSLSEARARAAVCRRLLREEIDPIERRQALNAETRAEDKPATFKDAAERYIAAHKAGWRSKKHADQWPSSMKSYVYPVIGDVPVHAIDTDRIMKILDPIWAAKPETASRVRSRIESVLDWATARKMRQGENPARWRGHLQALLPARSKMKAVEHHAALPFAAMNEFWRALAGRDSASAEALKFAILTAARTGEVIGARWSEIDLAANTWIIPAERMKAARQHRVALSTAAVAVLNRMKPLKGGDMAFVFPGSSSGGGLSNMAMAMSLRKMNRGELTVHGFRSTFRDWAAEATTYPNEMVEMALAHVIGNKAEAAYRRGDMVERRRQLMEDWATHCATAPPKPKSDPHGEGQA